MTYSVATNGKIWAGGVFTVPKSVVENYIKLASEYQIKALLIVLNNGRATAAQIAEVLGITENDVNLIMRFWLDEGVLTADGETPSTATKATEKAEPQKLGTVSENNKPTVQKIAVEPPVLTSAEIVSATQTNAEIGALFSEAQNIFGRTLSHAEKEMIVNLVNFYGLEAEVVSILLNYCQSQKEKGKKISTKYVLTVANNWTDEGITTIDEATRHIERLNRRNERWVNICKKIGVQRQEPTKKQLEFINKWYGDFGFNDEMVNIAVNLMLEAETVEKPTFSYINGILTKWHKSGVKTPEDVEKEVEKHKSAKTQNTTPRGSKLEKEKIKSPASYDLEKWRKGQGDGTEI